MTERTHLVTTAEAARELGVSRTTLPRWVAEGLIHPAGETAKGHYRWDLDDLRRQMRELRQRDEH